MLEGWITFETKVARGFGHIRLKNGLIWTLLTTMVELKGHEEPLGSARPLGIPHRSEMEARTWKEEREAEAAELGHSAPALLPHHRRRPGRASGSARG